MPDPSLVCGNGLWKLTDWAKTASWYVVFRVYSHTLNKKFRIILYIERVFQE
jgi:hypothetical protein